MSNPYKQVKPELFLAEKPYISINGEGQHIGYPVIFIRTQGCPVGCVWCDAMVTWPEKQGNQQLGIRMSFEELTALLDSDEYSRVGRIWLTGGEPTIWSAELIAFIRYYKKNGQHKRIWHLITSGYVFYKPLLYGVDWITIDIKPPSSKTSSSEDFIGWCIEDEQIRPKIEFKMVVANTVEDKNFALNQIKLFGKMPWTIQPLYWSEAQARKYKDEVEVLNTGKNEDLATYDRKKNEFIEEFQQPAKESDGWKSIEQFSTEFMTVVNNPNVRILTQYHKVVFPGRLSGI